MEGIAIFISKGAVRFRAYPQVLDEVQKVMDALMDANLIEGYAEVQWSIVYAQSFGGFVCAVMSLYTSRAPLSSRKKLLVCWVQLGSRRSLC